MFKAEIYGNSKYTDTFGAPGKDAFGGCLEQQEVLSPHSSVLLPRGMIREVFILVQYYCTQTKLTNDPVNSSFRC